MKTAIKAIALVVCIGLLIWNAGQKAKIQEGTEVKTVAYGVYTPDSALEEKVEASVVAIIPMVTNTLSFVGEKATTTSVSGEYCLLILDDFSVGAALFDEEVSTASAYKDWIVEEESQIEAALGNTPIKIRGKTQSPVVFDLEEFTDSDVTTQEEIDILNENFAGITLLDTTGDFFDQEVITPDLPSLGDKEDKVMLVAGLCGALLLVDVIRILNDKKKKQEEA